MTAAFIPAFPKTSSRSLIARPAKPAKPKKPILPSRKAIPTRSKFRSFDNATKTYRPKRTEAEIKAFAQECLLKRLANRTQAEVRFEFIIGSSNVLFESEKILYIGDRAGRVVGFLIADFYCHERRLVFEIDGGSHRGKEKYDAGRDCYLASKGITTHRFTNREVLGSTHAVIDRVKAILHA